MTRSNPTRLGCFSQRQGLYYSSVVVLPGESTGGATLDGPLRLMNCELRYSQRARSGLRVLWDNDSIRLYELSGQVRCRDEGRASIWADMRRGTLCSTLNRTLADTRFMKGEDTDVPGSSMALKPENAKERALVQASCVPRASRRVARDDPQRRMCTVQVAASRRTSRRSALYT